MDNSDLPLWNFKLFLEVTQARVPLKEISKWRACPPEIHLLSCELRGQPHHGTVIPYYTNGLHALVRRMSDNLILFVMFDNIRKIPRLTDKPERKPKCPTQTTRAVRVIATPLGADDFL